ncbi:MAG TPA: M48 family metalloprotease [Allosphingosinicella sp.]|nr:M48 family metalloprotease [Allosphingosinicella sp.]
MLTGRRFRLTWLARFLMLLALSFSVGIRPALAQEILRDAETEQLFRDMERPMIIAAGLRPENVQILVLQDRSINAFVAEGQTVYVHSGLIAAADNVNQVQGVVAHELGHIAGGHVIRMAEGEKAATGIMLLSLLLGAAAMAAGAGEAGAGIMAAGQQAAMGKFLAFSRTQEASADQAGAKFLNEGGVSGRGLIQFFKKLQNEEYRYSIPQDDAYAYTHPLTGDRIQLLQEELQASPSWNKPTDPALEARFQRVKAKLIGYLYDPEQVLVRYPESDHSEPARYARAYAYHKQAYPERALAEMDSLLKDRPGDPYYLELKGQILLESGKPAEALASLREAVAHAPDQPLIASLLGDALIATEKPQNMEEAKQVLRAAIARDNSNPFAWYQLGIVYDRQGDEPRAALATAERYNLQGQAKLALANAELAMRGLQSGTNDYLRAQDIAMVSRNQVDYEKKHHISEPK